MRITSSGFHVIYEGFLQLGHRLVITRVSCLRRAPLAALPENLLFTRDSCNFVRAREVFASWAPSPAITRIPRSHFGVCGTLTCDLFDRSAFSVPKAQVLTATPVPPVVPEPMGCSALQLAWREYVKALKKVAHEIGERSKPGSDKCQQNRTPTPDLRLRASSC